jgi:hypothetical protein
MRSTSCCGSPAHRYGGVERRARFQNPEAEYQKLAHGSDDNLLAIEAARDFNRVTSAVIAGFYRIADMAGI